MAFTSSSASLVAGDTNGRDDIFVRNTVAGTTVRVSLGSAGEQANDLSDNPALAADGAVVAFHSIASNLVPDDTNGVFDVFVRGPAYDASAYAYDRLSRLTSATEPIAGSSAYTYDPAGNRLSQVRGTATSYAYDRADRITAAGATSITVNAVGDLTAKGTDTFVYDQVNRLRSATVAGATETYAYDGDGVRFSRQVGANPTTRYVSDVGAGLPVTLDDGTRKYVWGLGLAYAVAGTSLEVYHADQLGSIRAITDGAGVVTATYRTDEWGVPTASTGASTQPFAFTGEPRDATGLSYLRARYYDPSLGRFMSRDPWPGDARSCQTLDRYAYAGNNPATFSDPSGRSPHPQPGFAPDLCQTDPAACQTDLREDLACGAGVLGGAFLFTAAGETALGATEAFAIGGPLFVLSGLGLVAIGLIGFGMAVFTIVYTCS